MSALEWLVGLATVAAALYLVHDTGYRSGCRDTLERLEDRARRRADIDRYEAETVARFAADIRKEKRT